MKKQKKLLLCVALIVTLNSPGLAAPLGTAFHYQGQLTDGGFPPNGDYDFSFSLFDAQANGNQIGSTLINDNVSVSKGLFTTTLDFGTDVFDGNASWLEVGVRPGNSAGAFTILSPRQPLLAVPYSIFALSAGIVPWTGLTDLPPGFADGADNDTMYSAGAGLSLNGTVFAITPGGVVNSMLADGSVTTPKLANAAVTTVKLADNSVTPEKIPAESLTGQKMAPNSVSSEDIADLLRLRELQIESAGGLDRVQLTEEANSGMLYMNHGSIGRFLAASGTTDGGFLRLYDALGGLGLGQTTVELGSSSVGGYVRVLQANDSTGVQINGQNGETAGGTILLYRESGLGITLQGSTSAGQGSFFTMYNGLGNVTVSLDADASGRGSALSLSSQNGTRVQLDGSNSSGAGQLSLYQGDGNTGAVIYGDDGQGSGAISLRKTNGNPGLRLYGGPASGSMAIYDLSGTETFQILGAATSTTGSELRMRNGSGNTTIELDGDWTPANGGTMRLFKADGTDTIRLQADFNGEGRIITQVLEITGGSDLSENFNIQTPDAQPGMIVRIDPQHPGELVVSDRAYDRTVAGVVSGAGGVKPGMLMGQRNSKADGKLPVALTGRVYCLVDASYGGIEPGDLITTSDTLGHGMKVTDHVRAQGAIVGKAMTGLASSKGLVLLLVNLQ